MNCCMCHHPVTADNRREMQRRVERRSAVSGRTRGYAYIHAVSHKDCSRTPEALAVAASLVSDDEAMGFLLSAMAAGSDPQRIGLAVLDALR